MSSLSGSPAIAAHQPGVRRESPLRTYLCADLRQTVTTVLGLIWLLDGALQFQSFMYGKGFVQLLQAGAVGQPHWLASSVNWGATTMQSSQVLFNTFAALVQVAIGLGLLYRRTAKPAIIVSFFWALVVWWFGEAFGMLFMNMANPLTGAPGAVIVYAVIAAIVWPNGKPGGLFGVLGSRVVFAVLWILSGGLWLLGVNSSANATKAAINAAPSGMSWLSSVQDWFANRAAGNGLIIALVLAALSVAIGVAVLVNWNAKRFLQASIVLSLLYWVVGQGFGGLFAGGATDPNAGPVFVLLSVAMWGLVGYTQPIGSPVRIAEVAPA